MNTDEKPEQEATEVGAGLASAELHGREGRKMSGAERLQPKVSVLKRMKSKIYGPGRTQNV